MNFLDVIYAGSPDRSQDHAASVAILKKKEDPYQGYCGNCFQIHEFPNCVQCQYYRIKPGRCTNCGVIDQTILNGSTLVLDKMLKYEELITPILEARKKKVAEETKKFITYKNCPLCKGYFHSAKACFIFRTHVKHFNLIKERMDLSSDEVNTTTRMVIPTTDLESD